MRAPALLAVCLILASATFESAHAQSPPVLDLSKDERSKLVKYFGNDLTAKAIPASPIDKPGDYMVQKHGATWTYKATHGDRRGKTGTATMKQASDGKVWHFDTGGNAVLHLEQAEDGSFHMPATEDRGQKVISRYEPAEPGVLAGLEPGKSRKMKINVGVYDKDKPDKRSHKGELDVTYTYVGAFEVTVPAGTYETILLKWHYKGKVGPAKVEDLQYWFLAKDQGFVAMVEKSDVSALLVYQDHDKHAAVLTKSSQ